MGVVLGNRWWVSLKYRIRDFAINYATRPNLARAENVKSLGGGIGDALAVDLVKGNLEREASKRYKDFLVRSMLRRVPNEAVKRNAFAREEEFQRFPCRHIESVKSPDGHVLRSNRDIREAFQVYFRDRFSNLPNLPIQEFRSYLADLPRLQEAEAAGCEALVTEREFCDVLKQVGLNKLPGLFSLPYEMYLRMSHMFVPILTDVFSHWFAQGTTPVSITKRVITLLKKGGRHIWEQLDNCCILTFDPGKYAIPK